MGDLSLSYDDVVLENYPDSQIKTCKTTFGVRNATPTLHASQEASKGESEASNREATTNASSRKRPVPNLQHEVDGQKKKAGKNSKASDDGEDRKEDSDWLDEFNELFPDDNSDLPSSLREVVRMMDALLSEREGIDFESLLYATGNRSFVNCFLGNLEEENDPRLAWRTPGGQWGPPNKEALKDLMNVLLEIARKIKTGIKPRRARMGFSKPSPGQSSKDGSNDQSWRDEFDQLFPDMDTPLPKTQLEIAQLMDALLGEKEGIDFVGTIYEGSNRRRVNNRLHQYDDDDDPRVAWHAPNQRWLPPDKEALEGYIEVLLEIAREDAREDGMETEEPEDGSSWRSKFDELFPDNRTPLPNDYTGVVQVMNSLMSEREGIDFVELLAQGTGRVRVNKRLRSFRNDPRLSWHEIGSVWRPPSKDALANFIGILFEIAKALVKQDRAS